MMERLRNILSIILVATATLQVTDARSFCCSPAQWTAVVRILRQEFHTDTPSDVTESSVWQTVNYDASKTRVAVSTFLKDEVKTYQRQVFDYRKGEHYVIEGEDEQKCVRHPLTSPFKAHCTPEGSTGLYFAGIGGMPENTVYFNQSDVTGYATVTLGDCAFVQEVTYANANKVVSTQNVQYMNQTLSVDPQAFVLPESCTTSTSAVTVAIEGWQLHSVIGSLQ